MSPIYQDLWTVIPAWLRLLLTVGTIMTAGGLVLMLFMYVYTLMYAVFGA